MKTSGVKKTVMKTARRQRALKRLQAQLKSGKKPVKNKLIDLSEKDIKRIKKEINQLKERI